MSVEKSKLLIYTGGTIGMQKGTDNSLVPFDFERFIKEVPELNSIDITLQSLAFKNPIDSSNMHPDNWVDLAEIIEKNYEKHHGFVILHGSDTMAYTASALSFLLENLSKPVILTGSQLPIGIRRTDAKENLITAIEIAASGQVSEVAVYFEYKLLRGNRTVKVKAEHFEAFDSPNYPYLAQAGVHIHYHNNSPAKDPQAFLAHKSMDTSVALLKLYPGISLEIVQAILGSSSKGIILETYGSGNAPTHTTFLNAISEAIESGKIILNISQCLSGSVSQGFYETSSKLEAMGVVSGKDMTSEAALTKMMFLLGQKIPHHQLKKQLSISLRGELS